MVSISGVSPSVFSGYHCRVVRAEREYRLVSMQSIVVVQVSLVHLYAGLSKTTVSRGFCSLFYHRTACGLGDLERSNLQIFGQHS